MSQPPSCSPNPGWRRRDTLKGWIGPEVSPDNFMQRQDVACVF
jgi:hypothetical protein